MDPLTSVGLAANIIQFISFVREVIVTGKQISKNADGALVENIQLEALTKSITELNNKIVLPPPIKSEKNTDGKIQIPKTYLEIRELCGGSKDVANTLLKALQSLKVSNSKSKKWTSLRQALNSTMSAQKIDNLAERLDRYQRGINTALLASLREELKLSTFNISRDSQHMDQQLLDYMDNTKKWQEDLINSFRANNWRPDSEHDVQVLGSRLESGVEIERDRLYQLRICHRLRFTDMEERHETIAETYSKTFEWAFHSGRPTAIQDRMSSAAQWDNFGDWLRGDGNVYWITGKPGSGKSTLMKYLYNHKITTRYIKMWAARNNLITAGFFFWSSGTTMQMSRMGLLQSLLYQIVKSLPELISNILPMRWMNCTLYGDDLHPWTWLELTTALKTLISFSGYCFLFFVDGLDEFDGDPAELSSLVQEVVRISPQAVKFCVASRPWLIFEESFGQGPWLRLEDLTRPDIELYASEKMQGSSQWLNLGKVNPETTANLIKEITEKACGVFLWVVLVVESLLSGLRDGDRVQDLRHRVDVLPSALEDLFSKMLDQLTPEYFIQACELFQMVQVAMEPLSLLGISFAQDGYKSALEASVCTLCKEEENFRIETMRRRILSRCKGLLEAPSTGFDRGNPNIQYLHRTVRDFFRRDDIWKYICSGAPGFEPFVAFSAMSLRLLKGTSITYALYTFETFWCHLDDCIWYARKLADINNRQSIEYLEEVGHAGDLYWRQESQDAENFENILTEAIFSNTFRSNRIIWSQALDCISVSMRLLEKTGAKQPLKNIPHWTNTLELGSKIDKPHVTTWKDIRTEASILSLCLLENDNTILNSFFDFAFMIGLNFYVLAKMDESLACSHKIGEQHLLFWSLENGDFELTQTLLRYGANPNAENGEHGTAWRRLLQISILCMRSTPVDRTKMDELFRLVEAFLNHGADPRISIPMNEETEGQDDRGNSLAGIQLEDMLEIIFASLGVDRIAPVIEMAKPADDKQKDSSKLGFRKRIKAKLLFLSTRSGSNAN